MAIVTGISDIPMEVLERILDSLHDDATALHSASFVCRDWVSAQRHHMFRQTVIKEVEVPFQGEIVVDENVQSFLSLVQSKHCTFLPAIRCAVLYITSSTSLIEVVKVLARAKALSQVVFFQRDGAFPAQSEVARLLPNIQDFTYNTWTTVDDDAWRLITSFSHLRALAVHTSANGTVTLPRDLSGSSFTNIVNFQLRLFKSEELFEWINNLEGSPFTRVETLDLRIFRSSHTGWGSVTALNAFLKRNSETMTNLSVAVDYQFLVTKDLSQQDIDLSPLIHLRSLSLQTHDMDLVCHSISSLSSRLVESLTVRTGLWAPDRHHLPNQFECHCNLYELFITLARIMEQKEFITGTIRHLEVPKERRFGRGFYHELGNVSVRWTQSGDVFPLSNANYDKQRNTMSSFGSLI